VKHNWTGQLLVENCRKHLSAEEVSSREVVVVFLDVEDGHPVKLDNEST
jgi:hypothetical protein